MTHVAWILYFVVWAVVIGIVWAMCRAAAKPAPKPTLADMLARTPNVLRTNTGRRVYAEGRPTMPSQIEPEDEFNRRTR
jgi:hypothetical protein